MWYLEEKQNNKIHEDEILSKILANRDINNNPEADIFLNKSRGNLRDPYQLTDVKKAVKRIISAIKNNQRILIYGDYDVDGITSTSLLINYFEEINYKNYSYYIPNRLKEGYGLNIDSLSKIDLDKLDLVITVDCGITALKEVEFLNKKDIDIIITDHHKLGESLPEAFAIIDPQREDDGYFKVLAGVGVVFKLLQAVDIHNNTDFVFNHLDLVALGTVADIVALKNDNRILVSEGLKIINKTEKVGLKLLIEKLGMSDKEINPGQIGYIIAPPINAIGRMEKPDQGVELLITNDNNVADEISQKLIKINKERQNKEEEIYNQALSMIDQKNINNQDAIILASKDWHRGVIGIVASRLIDKYYLPVILIAVGDDGIGHGSARSIDNFDITEGLRYCNELLENYGGHSMAAGLSIKENNLNKFKKMFNEYMNKELQPTDFIPGLKLDAIINLNKINNYFYKKLDKLKPFGVGNPRPKFLLSNVKLNNHYTVGSSSKHLKIKLSNGISGICFNMGHINSKLVNKKIDLAAKIYLNNWRGRDEIELRVEDINIRDDHSFYPLTFKKDEFKIYDKRGINNKTKYIRGLYNYNKKIAVFINGKKEINEVKNKLKDNDIDLFINNWDDFVNQDKSIILFNKSFNKKIKDKAHLIFYSIPFSLDDVKDIIKNFKSNKDIHFIFNDNDMKLNQKLIDLKLPDKKLLKNVMNYIQIEINEKNIKMDKLYKKINKDIKLSKNKFKNIINIYSESDILDKKENEISFNKSKKAHELDLSNSVYYNNIIKIKEDQKDLINLLRDKNLFNFIKNLTKLKEENNEF
ncbi:MAG: single-stranded-DNA-specific exonuclease RecJ [Bacillota bacterium]